jgi:NAD-dependent DNA ligase
MSFSCRLILINLFQFRNFVHTECLELYTRLAAASLIKEWGGKVTDLVSMKIYFVIAEYTTPLLRQGALRLRLLLCTQAIT